MAVPEEKIGHVEELSHRASLEYEDDRSEESETRIPAGDEKSRRTTDGNQSRQDHQRQATGINPDAAASRSRSSASSTRSRPLIVVPRNKRRGLFGRLTLLPEVECPYDYSNRTKWTITLIVALCGAGGPMGAGIFYPSLPEMSLDLNASATVINMAVALYMLAMSIFPLWWSFFSETFGRRTIYIISFSLFFLFSVLSAVSNSIAMLVVMRLLAGGASASVQAVGAGTIADIWEVRERGRAMGMFYLGPLTGPLISPIIGGALTQRWGWRSTMWFLAIFGGAVLVMIFSCLPETLARRKPIIPDAQPSDISEPESSNRQDTLSRISTRQSVQRRTKTTIRFLKRAFVDPLKILYYLRFPPITIVIMFASITFGALFILNIAVQAAFSAPPYNFDQLVVGALYLPSSLGYFIASALGGRWIDNIMAREARKAGRYDEHGKLIYLPEDRMRENAWISGTMYPAALIWFGWCVQFGVLWVSPAVANFFFGVGSQLIFSAATTMLTEFMPKRSSSGVALNSFVRNICSGVGAVIAQPLINVMGFGWLFTMVGLLTLVIGVVSIWSLTRFGPRWREEMNKKLNEI